MSARWAWQTLAKSEGGASAVEFALCLPLLATLLMGVFEFGWTQHCLSSVRFSLERAGRHLSVHPNATEAELTEIVEVQLDGLAKDLVSVTLDREARGPTGETGVLTAVYHREIGVPGLASIPVDYETSIEMPISQFDSP